MFSIHKSFAVHVAAGAVAVLGFAVSPGASAACSCMCVQGVAYEVCTDIVTTQAVTDQCTASLQCPADTSTPTDTGTGSTTDTGTAGGGGVADSSGDQTAADGGLDCRVRDVYRPDLQKYVPYKVCMPEKLAEAHERLRAKRQEMAARYAAQRHDQDGRTHRGRGPHDTWSHDRSSSHHDLHGRHDHDGD